MKVYPEDKKYDKELYDFLNNKLQVFYNYYNKVGLLKNQFNKTFSIILKNRANIYYYNYIIKRNLNFELIINIIRKYFEIKKNR